MRSRDDIVIVGAGPIGLAHAIGIKKLNPRLKVVVLEKYPEYQRKHNLVLEPQNLTGFMEATDTMCDPELNALLKQIQNHHGSIRTSALETVFRRKAEALGVEIITEEINAENFEAHVLERHPCLLIGADGTHSITSNQIFGNDNQIKHEFDYVLQLRYNVDPETVKPLDFLSFYQDLIAYGMAGEERVGSDSVTLQIMVTKGEFDALGRYTSKNPCYLYRDDLPEEKGEVPGQAIPKNIRDFLDMYLQKKIGQGVKIDRDSIRASVNEAPATHANNIYKLHVTDDGEQIPVLLVGDAGLGLSYFKGLNAGLASAAKCLSDIRESLRGDLKDQVKLNARLQEFEDWFQQKWAPAKVKEVKNFSTWQIRVPWMLIQGLQDFRNSSFVSSPTDDELNRAAFGYMNEGNFEYFPALYPHRSHPPVLPGQLEEVPVRYSLKKIAKLFTDFFAPYKWIGQIAEDFRQPLRGIGHVFSGLIVFFAGLFILKPARSLEGLFILLRGVVEIATTPLAWLVKPVTRGIATLFSGIPKIEDNSGFQKLVEKGNQSVRKHMEAPWRPEEIYQARALCIDIHRKFNKGIKRGQGSDIQENVEKEIYTTIRPDGRKEDGNDFTLKINKYLSLFAPKNPISAVECHSGHESRKINSRN